MTTAAIISLLFMLGWLLANTAVFLVMLYRGERQ
jgi:hypothetical protein